MREGFAFQRSAPRVPRHCLTHGVSSVGRFFVSLQFLSFLPQHPSFTRLSPGVFSCGGYIVFCVRSWAGQLLATSFFACMFPCSVSHSLSHRAVLTVPFPPCACFLRFCRFLSAFSRPSFLPLRVPACFVRRVSRYRHGSPLARRLPVIRKPVVPALKGTPAFPGEEGRGFSIVACVSGAGGGAAAPVRMEISVVCAEAVVRGRGARP